MAKKFAEYKNLNLTEINNQVLQQWKKGNIFSRSIEEREGCPEFVFYEGPPSANGHPGIHNPSALWSGLPGTTVCTDCSTVSALPGTFLSDRYHR